MLEFGAIFLIPNIPDQPSAFGTGGRPRRNTPQLAIGDNVLWRDSWHLRMQEMVDRCNGITQQQRHERPVPCYYGRPSQKIIELIEQMDLTVYVDIREIKKQLADLEKRSGRQAQTDIRRKHMGNLRSTVETPLMTRGRVSSPPTSIRVKMLGRVCRQRVGSGSGQE